MNAIAPHQTAAQEVMNQAHNLLSISESVKNYAGQKLEPYLQRDDVGPPCVSKDTGTSLPVYFGELRALLFHIQENITATEAILIATGL